MEVTPYGVNPYMKRLLGKLKPKQGYMKLYIPMGDMDCHEEEQ